MGQHPLVCKLLKGIFYKCHPQPKLFPSWSVNDVLSESSQNLGRQFNIRFPKTELGNRFFTCYFLFSFKDPVTSIDWT